MFHVTVSLDVHVSRQRLGRCPCEPISPRVRQDGGAVACFGFNRSPDISRPPSGSVSSGVTLIGIVRDRDLDAGGRDSEGVRASQTDGPAPALPGPGRRSGSRRGY